MVKIMFINQHTFSSMIFPYVWCLQNPSKPINVWWLNPRDFTPLNKALRPGRATSWLPRDDKPRSTPLDAQSRTSPAKSAKCPWLGKSSSFVVKLLGKITSSSFFSDPKMMGKKHIQWSKLFVIKNPDGPDGTDGKSHANTGIYLSRTGRRNRSPQKHMEFPIPHCLILTSRSLIHGCWPTFHLSKKVDDLFSIKATNTMWLCVFENSGSPRKYHGFNAV